MTENNGYHLPWTYFYDEKWIYACEGLNAAESVLLSRIVEDFWAAPIMTVSREDLMLRHKITAGSNQEDIFNRVFDRLVSALFISTKLNREY